MQPRLPSSVLVLSVDWHSAAPAPGQQEVFTADKLIRMLQRYQLATTWALQDPQVSPIPEMLHESQVTHDVSLLAREAWVSPGVERRHFGEQLHARLDAARDRGIAVGNLAIPAGYSLPHIDLVQKCGIRCVRMDDQRPPRDQNGHAYSLRYDLWNVPVSRTLPEQQHWIWNPSGSSRRMLQAVMAGHVAHVVIAGDQFAGKRIADLRTLESVLRNISAAQEAGRLQVETVTQFVSRLGAPQRKSARSILRKAA